MIYIEYILPPGGTPVTERYMWWHSLITWACAELENWHIGILDCLKKVLDWLLHHRRLAWPLACSLSKWLSVGPLFYGGLPFPSDWHAPCSLSHTVLCMHITTWHLICQVMPGQGMLTNSLSYPHRVSSPFIPGVPFYLNSQNKILGIESKNNFF